MSSRKARSLYNCTAAAGTHRSHGVFVATAAECLSRIQETRKSAAFGQLGCQKPTWEVALTRRRRVDSRGSPLATNVAICILFQTEYVRSRASGWLDTLLKSWTTGHSPSSMSFRLHWNSQQDQRPEFGSWSPSAPEIAKIARKTNNGERGGGNGALPHRALRFCTQLFEPQTWRMASARTSASFGHLAVDRLCCECTKRVDPCPFLAWTARDESNASACDSGSIDEPFRQFDKEQCNAEACRSCEKDTSRVDCSQQSAGVIRERQRLHFDLRCQFRSWN